MTSIGLKPAASRLTVAAVLLTGALSLAGAPASAAVVTFDSIGDTVTNSYNGIIDGMVTAGLTADVTYTLSTISGDQKTWTFSFSITNTSSAPITASRVSGIGFNLNGPLPASGSAAGVLSSFTINGNVPQLGFRDVCVSGNNCAGGAGGGVTIGNTGGGTFQLVFANAIAALDTTDFYVRYQSIRGDGINGDSGVGIVAGGIPEPATWAMMLIGFAGLGYAARRRATAERAA